MYLSICVYTKRTMHISIKSEMRYLLKCVEVQEKFDVRIGKFNWRWKKNIFWRRKMLIKPYRCSEGLYKLDFGKVCYFFLHLFMSNPSSFSQLLHLYVCMYVCPYVNMCVWVFLIIMRKKKKCKERDVHIILWFSAHST